MQRVPFVFLFLSKKIEYSSFSLSGCHEHMLVTADAYAQTKRKRKLYIAFGMFPHTLVLNFVIVVWISFGNLEAFNSNELSLKHIWKIPVSYGKEYRAPKP